MTGRGGAAGLRLTSRAVLLAAWCSIAQAAYGRAIILAPDGDDLRGDGSLANPYLTISQGSAQSAPGDAILLRGGVYYYVDYQWIAKSGTRSAPITIASYPGEWAILDGSRRKEASDMIGCDGVSHLVLRDFEIRNSRMHGMWLQIATDCLVERMRIHGGFASAAYFYGVRGKATPRLGAMTKLRVRDCVFYDNVRMNADGPINNGTGGWPGAVNFVVATGVTITGCTIYENWGEGILLSRVDRGLMRGNEARDNYGCNFYLDNATHCVCDRNTSFPRFTTAFYRDGVAADGIRLADEDYDVIENPSHNNRVTNNIIMGGASSFTYGGYHQSLGLRRALIAHNTFGPGQLWTIRLDDATRGRHMGSTFANNLCLATPGTPLVRPTTPAGIVFGNNCWFGGDPGLYGGPGDVLAAPRLAAAQFGIAEGARLQPDSPCIDAGRRTGVAMDYFGVRRSTRPDIGAHEYVCTPPRPRAHGTAVRRDATEAPR